MASPPSEPSEPSGARPFSEHSKPYSATSGCMIPIILVSVALVIGGWAAYSFWKQNEAIDRFTAAEPIPLEPATPEESTVEALHDRLRAFGTAALAAGEARIELDASGLNALIATEANLAPIRSMVRVESIRDGSVRCRVSFPLRALGGTNGRRYLNGRLAFVPRREDGIFFLDLTSMQSDTGVVDEGFISGYRHNRYLDSLFLHPYGGEGGDKGTVARVLERITSASIEEDRVILTASHERPASPP